MSRVFRFVFALAILLLPARAWADTVTMYTDQTAWNNAVNGTTATNLPAYFAANNIPVGYLVGPQTFGGLTFNSQQTNCQYPGQAFNEMYVDNGASVAPAGLYPFFDFPENSCNESGGSFISLPGQGATAFAFTVQNWPGTGSPPAFPGDISLYSAGTSINIGNFTGLDIHQPTFIGFTSTVPISVLALGLTETCANCGLQEFLITDVAFGSAGAPTTTPEPSSVALISGGLAGLVALRRRRSVSA